MGRRAAFTTYRRRRARVALATVSALSLIVASGAVWSGSASASVGSDQSDITKLEQQIVADGAHAQDLVGRYNEVQAHVNALDVQIAHDQARVAADLAVEATATDTLRRVAIKAYVSGSSMDFPTLQALGGTSDITALLEQDQYLGAVNGKQYDALSTLELDQSRTQDAQGALRSEQAQANKSLRELASAHDAATAAIASDEAKLTRVKGDLRSLLAAANARAHAKQQAEEEQLARAALLPTGGDPGTVVATVPTTTPTSTPSTPTTAPPTSSPGGYANPFRDATALSPERIDQGVDYSGFGPVYAIGDGVVLMTVGPGWPGGTFIAYQLTDGAAAGLVVYLAEDVESNVSVGATVNSNTVIGQMFEGPDGIETGWADGSRLPDTMARHYGQFNGEDSTSFGQNFSQFLQALGAPGGVENGTPAGSIPASWPRW